MSTQTWNIDTSHSAIHFSVRHMVIAKVRGAFTRWNGKLEFEGGNPANSKVAVSIETASIDTHEPKRDEHLRSADFLDAEKFPTIEFKSRAVEGNGSDLKIKGDLTIHGVTKEITLAAQNNGQGKDPWGNQRIAFEAKTSVNRKEFGLVWNQALETGGVLVGEDIEITLEIEAIRAQPTDAPQASAQT